MIEYKHVLSLEKLPLIIFVVWALKYTHTHTHTLFLGVDSVG